MGDRMSDPRTQVYLLRPDLRAKVRTILDTAYRMQEQHFGCLCCSISSPRWCADRGHVYCHNRRYHNV
jgi:hypothetical protein